MTELLKGVIIILVNRAVGIWIGLSKYAVYITSKLEFRELVDFISSIGFADDYREVMRLYDAMLPVGEKQYDWNDALVNFVFDNADIDTRTLTGHGTWHAMGGIACVTPAGEYAELQIFFICRNLPVIGDNLAHFIY